MCTIYFTLSSSECADRNSGSLNQGTGWYNVVHNYTVNDVQAQSLVIKTLGYDKMQVTVIMAVFSCTSNTKGKLK